MLLTSFLNSGSLGTRLILEDSNAFLSHLLPDWRMSPPGTRAISSLMVTASIISSIHRRRRLRYKGRNGKRVGLVLEWPRINPIHQNQLIIHLVFPTKVMLKPSLVYNAPSSFPTFVRYLTFASFFTAVLGAMKSAKESPAGNDKASFFLN